LQNVEEKMKYKTLEGVSRILNAEEVRTTKKGG